MSTEHLLADVGTILGALTSSSNAPRQEAEDRLRELTVAQPAEVLLVLAQIGSLGVGGFQVDDRFLALVLLGRVAFRETPGLYLNEQNRADTAPFDVIAERTRGRIESALCTGLKDEMNPQMRKGMGVCCATWTEQSAKRQRPFLPLPPVLLEMTMSPHPFHRYTTFQLLSSVPTLLTDSVKEPIPIQQIAQIILTGFHDPSLDVRTESLKAMRGVLTEGVDRAQRDDIGAGLVAEAFSVLKQLPRHLLPGALEPFVELASSYPDLFLSSLDDFIPSTLELIVPPSSHLPTNYTFSSLAPSTVHYATWEAETNSATELILSLVELRPQQLSLWRSGTLLRELVGLLIARQIAELSGEGEAEEWLERVDLEDEEDDYPEYAELALDRLAQTYGIRSPSDDDEAEAQTIIELVIHHTQQLLRRPEWRCRYTPLMAISAIAEGCAERLILSMERILSIIEHAASDTHPRVRYAWLHCIGQLSVDLNGEIQKRFSSGVLTEGERLLKDPAARVRAHAAGCLTNFFQNAELEYLAPFVDQPVRALFDAYHRGPLFVQEQVLPTFSNIAIQAETSFQPYYRGVMDLVLQTLSTASDDTHRKLVGRAMETATYAGLAVGKTAFATDALQLATIMMTIQNDVKAADDPRTAYLVQAWSTLCKSLGTDFDPFLPYVIPPLLKAAAYQPESYSSSEEDESTLKAHTAEMEEKALAFDNLASYAFELQDRFAPWLSEAARLAIAGLTDKHSESVRESAAFLVPGLLQVAKAANAWGSSDALIQIFRALVNAMVIEVDYGYLTLLYQSFTDSLHVVATALPTQLTAHLFRTTNDHLTDLKAIRQDRQVQDPHMTWDEKQAVRDDQEEEDILLDVMSKCLDRVVQYADEEKEAVKFATDELWVAIGQVREMRVSAA